VTRRRDDRGGVTVLVVALAGVMMLLGTALGICVALVKAHREAQSAADLSALAAAREAAWGGSACQTAARIARRNAADLETCTVTGSTVTVTVRVAGPAWHGFHEDLAALARAGPG
jgi:secretion/DNA translocation related TadE-like protein